YDINIDKNYQATTYVPTLTVGKLDELPLSEQYVNSNRKNRDWFNLMLKFRNRSSDWQNVDSHEDAVVWTESRLHLQTAWLAASSQMISNESDYLASYEYLPTAYANEKLDLHNTYTAYPNINAYTTLLNDDTITTLEYDQYFTSRLGAYNYGDWDLTSGIEFYYVMPQGIEPKLKDDNKTPDFSNVKAYIMNGGTSNSPQYEEINEDLVDISVVQTPYDSTINYLTPQIMQDPILSDPTMNRTDDIYVGKDSYYSSDEHKSWVFRVTVKTTLSKWFNRGTDTGYMMYVDIPSHVYSTPKDEYWYDEVMARPLDCANGALDKDSDSLYYQIYDTTTLWGNNYLPKMSSASRVSTQYGGMDYIWHSYYYYSNTNSGNGDSNINFRFINGSPNMPYINGMNISNREVSAQGEIFDSGKDNFSSGNRSTFASTGSRAHMRKPFIRTWTTVGKDNIDGYKAEDYYVDVQGDTSTLNIHVENKYWNNTLAVDYTWPMNHTGHYSYLNQARSASRYYKVRHTYATDGGNKGTLYYPVVTDILPAGIVPKDINGDLFTTDNAYNATKELAWSLYGADYSGNTKAAFEALDDEKALYSAKVEYIELDCEDESTEGRYMVTFWQEDTDVRSADKAKISSESSRVFSFDFFTQNAPDDLTEDFDTNPDLLDQYQSNSTFVSSSLNNFKFIIDSETANGVDENPFYVGNKLVTSYKESYNAINSEYWHNYYASNNVVDARHDISGTTKLNNGNTLPLIYVSDSNNSLVHFTNEAIDATVDRGDLRYFEDNGKLMVKKNYTNDTEELNFEDYYDIRQDVKMNSADIDKLDAHNPTGDIGVYTSNRIRCTRPNIENQTFVSYDPASNLDDLGKRSPNGLDGEYEYYPDEETHVDYLDNLYY
ncbi:MAG: hypothetical protein K2G56_04115, partial [Eubacterium sp.]|nr:hypothetical protein [Eubacterium sp.]